MHTSRRWPVAILCVGTALSFGATPLAACDPTWLPIARPEGLTAFVALALADTVLDNFTAPLRSPRSASWTARHAKLRRSFDTGSEPIPHSRLGCRR